MVTVPHKMAGLEGMSDYRGVGLQNVYCMYCILMATCSEYADEDGQEPPTYTVGHITVP